MAVNLIVVDDEEDIFKLYELFLKKEISEGLVHLHSFSSAKVCLNFMNSTSIDDSYVVFSDINMPEMDGYELLKNIKAKWHDVHVYMVSAYSRDDYIAKAKELGAQMLVAKPVDFQYIKELVSNYY